jgi:hypothetical protein
MLASRALVLVLALLARSVLQQNTERQDFVVGYGYFADDNLASITYPDNRAVTRTYTVCDELREVLLDNARVQLRSYNAVGLCSGIGYGNSKVETRSYAPNYLPSALQWGGDPKHYWFFRKNPVFSVNAPSADSTE